MNVEGENGLFLRHPQGPAYANILGDSAEIDDEEMEFERMRELLKEVLEVLNKAKAELGGKARREYYV